MRYHPFHVCSTVPEGECVSVLGVAVITRSLALAGHRAFFCKFGGQFGLIGRRTYLKQYCNADKVGQ